MRTYTFLLYGQSSEVSSSISFVDCADDDAALREAGRLLQREALASVEICDLRRDVGTVGWDQSREQIEVRIAPELSPPPSAFG